MSVTRRATWGILLAFALISLLARQVRAQSDHRLRWLTIETAHFRIHYHEPLGVLARELAAEADDIDRRIAATLGLKLKQRVELVLSDESDSANGFASVLPYNAIWLRPTAPDDLSPLADYDHWPRMLLTHEHTHVLHLEESGGVPRLLQRLFGRFYSPQSSLPGWFKEGLAVVQESRHTTGGRVRSTMFEMFMRMDALEDRVLGIDWIGFEGEPWPHGQVRYSYGQAFVDFLARRHGQARLGAFIEEYGRRLVPYGMNRALRRVTGETFVEDYRLFVAELREKSRETLARITREGRVEGVRLTQHGETTRSPRFVSNDELVYLVADARHVPELRSLSLVSGKAQRVTRVGSIGRVAPSRSGHAVYHQVAVYRGRYSYNELFSVELERGRTRQITDALRAREPDVSPDGKYVAYVTDGAGTSHLAIAELGDIARTRRLVVRSRRLEQVFTPRWSPDGTRIAYGAFERGGYRDLWVLDVASGARTRITYDRALDRGPVFSPDGKWLYFSSDRSGIDNLYAYEFASGAFTQLTNVIGGAFQPDVSPDGQRLVYVGYGSRGFDLHLLDLRTLAPRPAGPSYERPVVRALPEPAPLQSEPYRALRSIWPRYWELSFDQADEGTRLIVDTSGSDAVGLHRWAARALTNVEHVDYALELGYTNRQTRLPISLSGYLRERERPARGSGLVVSGNEQPWRSREGALTLATSFSVPRPLYTLSTRVEYSVSLLSKARPYDVELVPGEPHPRPPPLGSDSYAFWSATYASAQRQPFDISRSWGQVVTVSTTLRDPYLGSREQSFAIGYRAEQYVRIDVRESVLAFAYTGGHRGWYSVGGFPAQLVPLRDALLGSVGAPSDYARLRGFPSRSGENLGVLQAEYRLLLFRVNRGIETLPLFARRVHAAVFVDAGDAWTGRLELADIAVGVGAELRLDWSSDYGSDYTLRAGLARGVTEGGELQWYTSLATPF